MGPGLFRDNEEPKPEYSCKAVPHLLLLKPPSVSVIFPSAEVNSMYTFNIFHTIAMLGIGG